VVFRENNPYANILGLNDAVKIAETLEHLREKGLIIDEGGAKGSGDFQGITQTITMATADLLLTLLALQSVKLLTGEELPKNYSNLIDKNIKYLLNQEKEIPPAFSLLHKDIQKPLYRRLLSTSLALKGISIVYKRKNQIRL